MPRTALNKLIPKADYLLVRSFPKVAQRLESQIHTFDKTELDAYLKLLPGAVERFQGASQATNDLHESVESAISVLVTSFGSRNAAAVEAEPELGTSNSPAETAETADSVGDSELPNGSDTDQSVASITLPHNELEASAGSGGEPDSAQAGPRNPRVRTTSKLQGRRARGRPRRASGESAGDRGRLSESEGGS